MKLGLQVLFTQGYLWRDRFPARFDVATGMQPSLVGTLVWGIFVPSAILVGAVGALGDGDFAAGILALILVASWIVWTAASRWFDRLAGGKALWLSVYWASGSVMVVMLVAVTLAAPLAGKWALTLFGVSLLLCCATGYLNALQRNYLMFAHPEDDAHVLTAPTSVKMGFIAAWRAWLIETYWRLPRQILAGVDKSSPPTEDGMA
jgi:hypothetical protein